MIRIAGNWVCLFFQAEDGIRDGRVTGVQTCALPISQQIPLGSGTVKVRGSGIPAGHTVWVAGRQIPVDSQGNFAAEEILPAGTHSVEVAVLDDAGNGSLYLRDLEFKRTD